MEIAQTRRQVAGYAVRFCKREQTRPIREPEQSCQTLPIGRWRSALQQGRPFVPEKIDVGWKRWNDRLGHNNPRLV